MASQAKVFDRLGEQAADSRLKTQGTCPVLQGDSPDALRTELRKFHNYVNDARIKERVRVFKLARAHRKGLAQAEMELYVSRVFGGPEDFYKAVDAQSSGEWADHWKAYVARLKHTVGLDDTNELANATREYQKVTLPKNATLEDLSLIHI